MGRGQYALTEAGYKRLRYLAGKYGVPIVSSAERAQWRAWHDAERKKPFRERAICYVDEEGLRLIREAEYGATLDECLEVVRINRGSARLGARSETTGDGAGSWGPDQGLYDTLAEGAAEPPVFGYRVNIGAKG